MSRERPSQIPFEFIKPTEKEKPYEPSAKEEHERLSRQYEDKSARRAPLSDEARLIIKDKRTKKIRKMVRGVTEAIKKQEAEDEKKRLQKRIKKILSE